MAPLLAWHMLTGTFVHSLSREDVGPVLVLSGPFCIFGWMRGSLEDSVLGWGILEELSLAVSPTTVCLLSFPSVLKGLSVLRQTSDGSCFTMFLVTANVAYSISLLADVPNRVVLVEKGAYSATFGSHYAGQKYPPVCGCVSTRATSSRCPRDVEIWSWDEGLAPPAGAPCSQGP